MLAHVAGYVELGDRFRRRVAPLFDDDAGTRARAIDVAVAAAIIVLVVIRLMTAIHRGVIVGEGDLARFRALGLAHGRPYVDYRAEYPIGLLAIFKLVAFVAPSAQAFGHVIVWLEFSLDLTLAALLWWGWGRGASVFYLVAAVFLSRLLYARADFIAVTIAVAAIAIWRRRGRGSAAGWLATGAAIKVWPAALVLLVWGGAKRTERNRAMGWFAAIGLPIALVWLVIGGLNGPLQVLTFRGARGWEIESLGGGLLLAVHAARVVGQEGAYRIGVIPIWATVALWGTMLPVAGWAGWRGGKLGRLGTGWVGSVGTLLIGSTLLSAQFVVWLLPGAAIAWSEGDRVGPLLLCVAAALTGYEMHDFHALIAGQTGAVVVLLIRNAALVAAVGVSLWRLTERRSRGMIDLRQNPTGGQQEVVSVLESVPTSADQVRDTSLARRR